MPETLYIFRSKLKTELKQEFCSRYVSFLESLEVHNMKTAMTDVSGWGVSRFRAVKIFSFGHTI